MSTWINEKHINNKREEESEEMYQDESTRGSISPTLSSKSMGSEETDNGDYNSARTIRRSQSDELELFKDVRHYLPRKKRSCHRRSHPITEEERKSTANLNSRNYTKRNRDELANCNTILKDKNNEMERMTCIEENLLANDPQPQARKYIASVNDILNSKLSSNISTLSKDLFMSTETHRKLIFNNHSLLRKVVKDLKQEEPEYKFENAYRVLKKKYEEMEFSKPPHESTQRATSYASAKCRIKQRYMLAKSKRDCFKIHNALEFVHFKLKEVRSADNEMKTMLWQLLVSQQYAFLQTTILTEAEKLICDEVHKFFTTMDLLVLPSLEKQFPVHENNVMEEIKLYRMPEIEIEETRESEPIKPLDMTTAATNQAQIIQLMQLLNFFQPHHNQILEPQHQILKVQPNILWQPFSPQTMLLQPSVSLGLPSNHQSTLSALMLHDSSERKPNIAQFLTLPTVSAAVSNENTQSLNHVNSCRPYTYISKQDQKFDTKEGITLLH